MDAREITYVLERLTGESMEFKVALSREPPPAGTSPAWTRLEHHQCENCPAEPDDLPFCPPAQDVSEIVTSFSDVVSYETLKVTVHAPERSYFKQTDAQYALESIFGLLMASSRCPILSRLRPMAHNHLPFASIEETIVRTAGTYLIRQHLASRNGTEIDFELQGLQKLYQDLQIVNRGFTDRLQNAVVRDSSLNAVVELGMLSFLISTTLDQGLERIRHFYED